MGRGWRSRKHRGGGRESKHGPRPPSALVGCAGDRRALGRLHTAGTKLLSERGGHVCPGDAWAAGLPGWGWGCRGGRAQSPSSGSSVWVMGGGGGPRAWTWAEPSPGTSLQGLAPTAVTVLKTASELGICLDTSLIPRCRLHCVPGAGPRGRNLSAYTGSTWFPGNVRCWASWTSV